MAFSIFFGLVIHKPSNFEPGPLCFSEWYLSLKKIVNEIIHVTACFKPNIGCCSFPTYLCSVIVYFMRGSFLYHEALFPESVKSTRDMNAFVFYFSTPKNSLSSSCGLGCGLGTWSRV